MEELNDKADIASIELMLIGNKNDLEASREIPREKAEEVANKIGIGYEETSAKTYDATAKAFNQLIDKILKRKKKEIVGGISNNIVLTNPNGIKKDKKSSDCC